MTGPLPNSTPLLSNPLLDLNLNMKINPKTTVCDSKYNMKYQQPDTLNALVLFDPTRQERVNHAMSKVRCSMDFRPYIQSLNSIE